MDRRVELLVIARQPPSVSRLCAALEHQGLTTDVASDVAAARQLFLARGGHRLLVVGPDAGPGLAARVMGDLRAVDPSLPVVAFGKDAFRDHETGGVTRVTDYHPSSRAGAGAVMKVVQSLLHGR